LYEAKVKAIGTAAVLLAHTVLRPLVNRIETHRRTDQNVETYYRLRASWHHPHEAVIRMVLLRHVGNNPRMSLQGLATEETEKERTVVIADIYAVERNDRFMEDLVKRISIEPEVVAVSWERSQG
jgi:putative Mg2+ transporter-C (MgtC) family protein